MENATARDDRILPETHWASLLVFCVLIPALIVLWILPDRTADLFAWTISPDLTPIFMGSIYGAGAYFFARVFFSDRWHPASAVVLGVAAFATLNLIITLIHWDKFNQGDAPFLAASAFYLWLVLYIVFPPLVTTIWLRNNRTDPRTLEPQDPIVSGGTRLAARVSAIGALLAAAFLLIWPDGAIDVWPWELTPLTSRILGAAAAQIGVAALVVSGDERWSAWRLFIQTVFVALALLLIGAIRAWDDFDESNPLTWLYLGSLIASGLLLVALYRRMEGRRDARATA